MQAGEQTAGQDIVAAHGVEKAADAGLGSQARAELRENERRQEDHDEEIAADLLGDLVAGGIDGGELEAGMGELDHIARRHEDGAAGQGHDQDGARNGAPGIPGLLRQRGDGIKTEEGIGGDGSPRHRSGKGHVRLEERRRCRQATSPARCGDIAGRQQHKGGDDGELHQHQHEIDPARESNAEDVDHGGGEDEGNDPDPARHGRKGGRQIGRADQPDHHRQEEIVEQDGPANQEADTGAQRSAGIGIGRASHRIDPGHHAIAQGSQQDGTGSEQIGHRRGALACRRQRPEGAEHDHRRHIGQAEQDHRPQAQGPVQLHTLHRCSPLETVRRLAGARPIVVFGKLVPRSALEQ